MRLRRFWGGSLARLRKLQRGWLRKLEKGRRMVDPNQILTERNAEVERIKGYVDLTPEARDRRIAEATERANREYTEAREAEKQEREARLKNSERAVFNVVDDATASPAERA
jgi:hypothetical protein